MCINVVYITAVCSYHCSDGAVVESASIILVDGIFAAGRVLLSRDWRNKISIIK